MFHVLNYLCVSLSFTKDCSSPTALRCLGHFLTTKTKKKAAETSIDADVPFVIKEVPVQNCNTHVLWLTCVLCMSSQVL